MAAPSYTDNSFETALFADMRTRFHAAIHSTPLLFHDVLQTGFAVKNSGKKGFFTDSSDKLAYEIILLHGNNIDNDLLGRMMDLQARTARVQAPDPANVIDYKSEDEIINHYANGGLGLAVLGVDGTLIGQTTLSINNDNMNIGWLMIDKNFGGNLLYESMMRLAVKIADGANIKTLGASVRIDNKKGVNKFSSMGFTVTGIGSNAKDGAPVLYFGRETKGATPVQEHMGTSPLSLRSLQEGHKIQYLENMIEEGFTVKWNRTAQWFMFCIQQKEPRQDSGSTLPLSRMNFG